jgi:hypothetical protein
MYSRIATGKFQVFAGQCVCLEKDYQPYKHYKYKQIYTQNGRVVGTLLTYKYPPNGC